MRQPWQIFAGKGRDNDKGEGKDKDKDKGKDKDKDKDKGKGKALPIVPTVVYTLDSVSARPCEVVVRTVGGE